MLTDHWLKVTVISLFALQAGLSSTQAQRRGLEAQVQTGTPPGLIKKVEPEYPPGFVVHGAEGKGRFRLTINPKSGEVHTPQNNWPGALVKRRSGSESSRAG